MRLIPDVLPSGALLPIQVSIAGLLFCTTAYSAPSDTRAEIGYLFDDNVTWGQGGYKMADQALGVSLNKYAAFPVSDQSRALLAGALGGEKYMRHDGLSRVTGSVQGEIQYRRSAEFGAPVLAFFAKISADQYQSGQRDGFRHSTGISWRKTMTDRIRVFGAVSHNERNGNNAVFDTRDNAARINLDYEFKMSGNLYLGGEYRRGDIVITAPRWNVYNSSTADDVFSGWQLYNYRLDGTTTLYKAGYNFPLGSRDSIDFSWSRAQATTSYVSLPSWNRVPLSYTTNQYSLAYLVRF